MTCTVCDGERVVVLGTGSTADFFACPACVGLRRSDLTSACIDDVVLLCAAEDASPIWLDSPARKRDLEEWRARRDQEVRVQRDLIRGRRRGTR